MTESDKKRRVLDVEDLLTWAYRDELPKRRDEGGRGEPCSISPMFRNAALGGRVDNWTREPGMPAALGDPHPDALLVEEAVRGLAAFRAREIAIGADWLAPDFAELGIDEAAAVRRAMRTIDLLVVVNARLRRRPPYDGPPSCAPVILANGKPSVVAPTRLVDEGVGGRRIESEALLPTSPIRAGTYRPGAQCPVAWSPEPQAILVERAEYAVWRMALEHLAGELAGRLATISVLPPSAPERPWLGEPDLGKPVTIREDLRARVHRPARAAAKRLAPLPPRRRGSEDPRAVPRPAWPRIAGEALARARAG